MQLIPLSLAAGMNAQVDSLTHPGFVSFLMRGAMAKNKQTVRRYSRFPANVDKESSRLSIEFAGFLCARLMKVIRAALSVEFDLMPLDHPIQSLTVNCQDAGGRLLVTAGALKDLRYIFAFDIR